MLHSPTRRGSKALEPLTSYMQYQVYEDIEADLGRHRCRTMMMGEHCSRCLKTTQEQRKCNQEEVQSHCIGVLDGYHTPSAVIQPKQ